MNLVERVVTAVKMARYQRKPWSFASINGEKPWGFWRWFRELGKPIEFRFHRRQEFDE